MSARRKFQSMAVTLLLGLVISACATSNGVTGRHASDNLPHDEPAGHDMRNMFPEVKPIYEKVESNGALVEFTVKSEDSFLGNAEVTEEGYASVRFKITDARTQAPIEEAKVAAWMDVLPEGQSKLSSKACQERVAEYTKGLLTSRPLVDLNGFFVLAMNSNATISVIDPLMRVADMTQLYAMIVLKSSGEDWALSEDGRWLYVSMPAIDEVAVVDTESFRVVQNIPVGSKPMRMALQPDGRQLWVVADSKEGGKGGVTVIDVQSRRQLARLSTGGGRHEITFSPDGRYAYVTNEAAGTLTLVDTAARKRAGEVRLGGAPVGVAYSAHDGNIYVADAAAGLLLGFRPDGLEQTVSVKVDAGVSSLDISEDGKWLAATNPQKNQVYLIDLANGARLRTLEVPARPFQTTFAGRHAYIRSLDRSALAVVDMVEAAGTDQPTVTTLNVSQAPADRPALYSVASSVFPSAEKGAVLIANPGDGQVYYAMEGSAAPAGTFGGSPTVDAPRAARILNRSLHEEAPGLFAGRVRIPQSGTYAVGFVLENPRVIHCFDFNATPPRGEEVAAASIRVESTNKGPLQFRAGEQFDFKFRLIGAEGGPTPESRTDIAGELSAVGGNWHARYMARDGGDGNYVMSLTAPKPGSYRLFLSTTSGTQDLGEATVFTVQVVAGP